MTLTAEQLREIMCVYGNTHPCYLAAAECLANREAQPVLYASEETLAYAKEGEKSLVTWSEPMGDAVIPLYTAPPAPAVPDALANDIDSDDHPLLWSYNNGWNACRAAMLAAATGES